ncbi:hypothetical protein [Synechococcus sp. BIOS-E4-1]|uniref:hypothetical protein n=1 Tax=Synechococcus sp. BIOS-E4-1 TaxID=1400864 RepID=UPI00164655E6|nr:hypothetical protein [Synechococcus sp. BIOS-E4-1]
MPLLTLPYGDTWDTPVRWVLAFKAQPTANPLGESLSQQFSEFVATVFSQHNESRKVTLKVLALSVDSIMPVFGPAWHLFSFLIRAFTILIMAFPLFGTLRKSSSDSVFKNKSHFLFYLIVGYGLFVYACGPANLWNGLWEVQTSFFLGILFAMLAISFFASMVFRFSSPNAINGQSDDGSFQGSVEFWSSNYALSMYSVVFSWLSIFSFSGNIALSVVCTVLLFCGIVFNFKQKANISFLLRSPSFLWSVSSLFLIYLSVLFFFVGWVSPPHHDSLRGGLSLEYVALFLGNFYQTITNSSLFSYFIAFSPPVLILLAGIYFVKRFNCCPKVFLIYSAQLIFLLGLACASSIGRSGAGVDYALETRYNSMSILYGCITLFLLFYLVSAPGLSNSFRVFFSALSALTLVAGTAANIEWYDIIYSKRVRLQRAEKCFKDSYLSPSIFKNMPDSERRYFCSRGFYPNYESLGAWIKVHACSDDVLSQSRTAEKICEQLNEL